MELYRLLLVVVFWFVNSCVCVCFLSRSVSQMHKKKVFERATKMLHRKFGYMSKSIEQWAQAREKLCRRLQDKTTYVYRVYHFITAKCLSLHQVLVEKIIPSALLRWLSARLLVVPTQNCLLYKLSPRRTYNEIVCTFNLNTKWQPKRGKRRGRKECKKEQENRFIWANKCAPAINN